MSQSSATWSSTEFNPSTHFFDPFRQGYWSSSTIHNRSHTISSVQSTVLQTLRCQDLSLSAVTILYLSIYIALLAARAFQKHWYCVEVNTPKRYRQLRVKGLPKVRTFMLELDSKLQPYGRNVPNRTIEPPCPTICICNSICCLALTTWHLEGFSPF